MSSEISGDAKGGGYYSGPTMTLKMIASGTIRPWFSAQVGDHLLFKYRYNPDGKKEEWT